MARPRNKSGAGCQPYGAWVCTLCPACVVSPGPLVRDPPAQDQTPFTSSVEDPWGDSEKFAEWGIEYQAIKALKINKC
ncbi:hypothetical protein DSO57_1005454, partial [Entomophthora muscae]